MPYNHKISDLLYKIDGLVPQTDCSYLINTFEKYSNLSKSEKGYKHKSDSHERDTYKSLNLCSIDNSNEDTAKALEICKKWLSVTIANYVAYIRGKKISPDFRSVNICSSDNIRILKYMAGQNVGDHTDVGDTIRASCTLNLNEGYEGGDLRFFDGQIKHSLKRGDAIMFPAEPIWVHGTEPIQKGIRYAVNCFLSNNS
jgi:hypothetical protein|tara:strand:+ start:510 stop:1106 length:597 start_codon:yes stop_codon:yes gene_type:complete